MIKWFLNKYQQWMDNETCKYCNGTGEIEVFDSGCLCCYSTLKCSKCDGEGVR